MVIGVGDRMLRKRVLIVKLSSLGDIFHALPTVRALKAGLDADIDWVTQPEYVDLVRCFTDVSRVIPFPRRGWIRGVWPFLKAVRGCRYDLVVDLQGLLKSALVSKLASSRKVIGPSFHREGSHLLYDQVAGPCDRNRHAVEEALDVVRLLGLVVPQVEFPVVFPEVEIVSPRPRVAVIPVSRWGSKNWPVEHYAEVTRLLMQRDSASIYLMGGGGDRDICATLQHALEKGQTCSRVINLAGRTSLVEMGSWLKGMDVVLANDSGPIHMAAAVNIPVVAMFGPTDPVRTGPYGKGHRVMTMKMDCRPCFNRTCARDALMCMRGIRPEAVYEAASLLLAGRST